MLMVVDVGNTHIVVGVFAGKKLLSTCRFAARGKRLTDELKRWFSGQFKKRPPERWEGIAWASVVPELNSRISAILRSIGRVPVLTITPTMKLPIKNAYHSPAAVGIDRLMNAVAAEALFRLPVLVVDLGTAITLDVIDGEKRFVGGAILPGLHLARQALAQGTSQIGLVKLKNPSRVIGKTTPENVRAGIILGTAGAIRFLVRQMKRELAGKCRVVVTGGFAQWLKPHSPKTWRFIPTLTLAGIRRTWEFVHG